MLSISPHSRLDLQWDYSDEDDELDFAIVCPPFQKESVHVHQIQIQKNAIHNGKLNIHCITPETGQELSEILGYPVFPGSESENFCGSDFKIEQPKMAQILRRFKNEEKTETIPEGRPSRPDSLNKSRERQKPRDFVMSEMAAKSSNTSEKSGKKKHTQADFQRETHSFQSLPASSEYVSTGVLPMPKNPNEIWIQVPRKPRNKKEHKPATLLQELPKMAQRKPTEPDKRATALSKPEIRRQKLKNDKTMKLPGPGRRSRHVPSTTITKTGEDLEIPPQRRCRFPSITNLVETATVVFFLYIAISPVL